MVNPRLGVLALQALNPKRGEHMAKHWGKSHMAWVRSFQKNPHKRRKHHYRRKKNPYPLGGAVAALGNPHRRRKRHTGFFRRNPISSSVAGLGLPGFEQIIYGGVGFVGTAAVQGVIDNFMPATSNASTSTAIKYLEIVGSIVIVSFIMKGVSGQAAGNLGAVGGGIFLAQQAAHDFAPGMIPGMHAYTPLKGPGGMRAYTTLFPSSTMGKTVGSAGGGMPQLAARGGMRAPAFGQMNTVESAPNGGMDIVQQRFRRFQ